MALNASLQVTEQTIEFELEGSFNKFTGCLVSRTKKYTL